MAELERGSYAYRGNQVAAVQSTQIPNAIPQNDEHGAFNLANNPELYEVARTNNFEFQVYGLKGLPGAPGAENVYAVGQPEDVIRLSTISSSVPKYQQQALPVKRGNTTINFAGTPTYQAGKINVYDYIGAGTYEALALWQNMSFNVSNGKVGLAKDYKKTCILTEYTPTWQAIRQWKLYGCWISNLQVDDMTYDNNNVHKMSADITYDYAMLEPLSV